jgi:hypothetical protein
VFRLFNHVRGPLGQVTRTAARGETMALRIDELGLAGVDPTVMVVRRPASGDRLGARVAVVPCNDGPAFLKEFCTPATVQEPGVFRHVADADGAFDVFLMDATREIDYAGCVAGALSDADPVPFIRGGDAFSTLRLAPAGERLVESQTATAAPSDEAFRRVAADYSRAMNPFGIRYGALDFAGSGPAEITGGYVASPSSPWESGAAFGGFWVTLADQSPDVPIGRRLSYATVFLELGHVFLGQPYRYLGWEGSAAKCNFPVAPDEDPDTFEDGWPVLSDLQRDLIAYWTLLFS